MAKISFDKVHKTYPGGLRVIDDLNLEIADGELLVLVGPSGCGKSTAMRMVAGLEEVSAGEIRIGGRVINDLPPQHRNVAMVFQNYALYPHMTVRRNLEFPLRMRKLGREEIERRVRRAAQMLDLTGLLERRPKALSGGQRQRVAMGRAIVRDADVFLMDEPLSNLDARLRLQIRTEIAELQSRLGVTTIYVTHDQVEAMTLGHRVAVMRAGQLQQVAAPRELYDRPANMFVAGFIGSPGMNVLRGRLVTEDGHLGVRLGSTWLALPNEQSACCPGLGAGSGEDLLVGIRPAAIALAHGDYPGTLTAKARAAESLGHETILHVDVEAITVSTDGAPTASAVVVVLPGHHPFRPGDALRLRIDAGRLHFFAPDGNALSNA